MRFSGDAGGGLLNHLAADSHNLLGSGGSTEEANGRPFIKSGFLAGPAQYQNGDCGQTRDELGDEGGTAETGTIESHNYQGQALGKGRIFNQNERFGGIRCSLNVVEVAPQDGLANMCLQRFVIDQQNCCHVQNESPCRSTPA